MASAQYFVADFKDAVARRKVTGERVLFVEGADELWFFDHLLSGLGASTTEVQVIDFGGTGHFEKNLENLLKEDRFLDDEVRALAIIQDADRNLKKKTYDFGHKYAKVAGVSNIPVGMLNRVPGKNLHVGAFLLPNCSDNGNLDTLMLATVANDPAKIDAAAYINTHDQSKSEDRDKRVAQTYLATRKELHRGVGLAARSGCFNLTDSATYAVMGFLRNFLAV